MKKCFLTFLMLASICTAQTFRSGGFSGGVMSESDPIWQIWRTNAAANTTNAIVGGVLTDIATALGQATGAAKTNTLITSSATVTFTNTQHQTIYITNAVTASTWDGWMQINDDFSIDFFNVASNAFAFPTNWQARVALPVSGTWTNGTLSVYKSPVAGTWFCIGDFQ